MISKEKFGFGSVQINVIRKLIDILIDSVAGASGLNTDREPIIQSASVTW